MSIIIIVIITSMMIMITITSHLHSTRTNTATYVSHFFVVGGIQIHLRTEGRENGDLGGSSPLIRGSAQSANE
jgi:hypothetical protein